MNRVFRMIRFTATLFDALTPVYAQGWLQLTTIEAL
jgi:hypothetical protein